MAHKKLKTCVINKNKDFLIQVISDASDRYGNKLIEFMDMYKLIQTHFKDLIGKVYSISDKKEGKRYLLALEKEENDDEEYKGKIIIFDLPSGYDPCSFVEDALEANDIEEIFE